MKEMSCIHSFRNQVHVLHVRLLQRERELEQYTGTVEVQKHNHVMAIVDDAIMYSMLRRS